MSENTGWICPKCGAVHAPSVKRCDCVQQKKQCDDPLAPFREVAERTKWTHKRNPFEDMPRFDFMVRPWLVTYTGDAMYPDVLHGWVTK